MNADIHNNKPSNYSYFLFTIFNFSSQGWHHKSSKKLNQERNIRFNRELTHGLTSSLSLLFIANINAKSQKSDSFFKKDGYSYWSTVKWWLWDYLKNNNFIPHKFLKTPLHLMMVYISTNQTSMLAIKAIPVFTYVFTIQLTFYYDSHDYIFKTKIPYSPTNNTMAPTIFTCFHLFSLEKLNVMGWKSFCW